MPRPQLAASAVEAAGVAAAGGGRRVELAPEPSHGHVEWRSSYRIDPATVPLAEKVALLGEWSRRLLEAPGIDHTTASLLSVTEDKHFADLAGTVATQRRVRLHPQLEALALEPGGQGFETMRTVAPPVGRGWEYLQGEGWDWEAELAELPDHLAEKLAAPSIDPGPYDLVIDPTNLWLTIHESIGHATELDRAMGYEAAYAGTSFATFDKLGTLHYGSPVMQVTADRTTEHGLATVAIDDEGTEAQRFDLVADGILRGDQLDRTIAANMGLRSLQRLRLRRLPAPHPHPADGQRLAAAGPRRRSDHPGPDRRSDPGSVHRRRQELVHRHAALQLPVHRAAVLPHRRRPAGRAGPRRGLPGHHHRLLGRTGGGRWRIDLPVGRGLQLRQGPAGSGGPGEPRLPLGADPPSERLERPSRGRTLSAPTKAEGMVPAQEVVEQALSLASGEGCIVVVEESSEAEIRFANNTTTTNGVRPGRTVSVISLRQVPGGVAAGIARRAGDVEVAELVRAAEHDANGSPAAEDAMDLVAGSSQADFDLAPSTTSLGALSGVVAELGGAFGRAEGHDRILAGFAEHAVRTSYLGTSTGLRARHAQPTGALHLVGRSTDQRRSAWAGVGAADFSTVTLSSLEETVVQRLEWASAQVALDAGRYEVVLPPAAVADLMVTLVEAASGQDAQDGRSVFSGPDGRTRLGETLSLSRSNCAATPANPASSVRPSWWPKPRAPTSRSSTTAWRSNRPRGSRAAGSSGCATTAPARPGPPRPPPHRSTIWCWNYPAARATSTTWWPAPSGDSCSPAWVHPRGRSGHPAPHRAHP